MNNGYLGKNLKKLRKDNKISQSKLGDMLGVSGAYIQQLEKEVKTNPSIDLIYKISNYFDVAPMKLLEWDLSEPYQDYAEMNELSNYLRDQARKKDDNYNTDKYFKQLFVKPSEWEENNRQKAIAILLKESGSDIKDFTEDEYARIEKSLIEYLSTIAYMKK
ncbi:XRE family transcriptional regulator [Clostridium chromiireducens]|uniref:XRE family transcriptional regulator n=1 Tax=Clostridium chromiireducens TaxID=225345 RepID=A0A399IGR9_9CLOT|nr:helix-turn-helix transcriptional regulator [Clostridium chromiireducens]RII32135.1 XRE family transcriptional regulator [Clostridium chromiireducens]